MAAPNKVLSCCHLIAISSNVIKFPQARFRKRNSNFGSRRTNKHKDTSVSSMVFDEFLNIDMNGYLRNFHSTSQATTLAVKRLKGMELHITKCHIL
jgi:hypothetical protein